MDNKKLTQNNYFGDTILNYQFSAGDFDLCFSYCNSAAGDLLACLRDAGGGNNTEYLHITPTSMSLEQYVNNNWSGLDYSGTATDLNSWYDVHVQCVGGAITVWRGPQGGDMTQVLSTTSAAITTTNDFYFLPSSGTGYQFARVSLTSSGLVKWTAFAYNAGNELTGESVNGATATTYTYDQYGRRSTKAHGGSQAVYSYAFNDKLLSVVSNFPGAMPEEDYVYDGLGKMRYLGGGLDGGLSFRWEKGWNMAGVYFDSDPFDITPGAFVRFINHPQQDGLTPLATDSWVYDDFPNGHYSYTYNFLDNVGSVRDVRDDSQNQQSFTEYDPYGGLYAGTSNYFAGHIQDPGTGMYFAPFRWYDPEVARWMTRDPIGIVDGPNVYGYVGASPAMMVDPLGLYLTTCKDCTCPSGQYCQTHISQFIGCMSHGAVPDAVLFGACVAASGGVATIACILILLADTSASIECLNKATYCDGPPPPPPDPLADIGGSHGVGSQWWFMNWYMTHRTQ